MVFNGRHLCTLHIFINTINLLILMDKNKNTNKIKNKNIFFEQLINYNTIVSTVLKRI